MASLLGRPMSQFGSDNENNKSGLEGQQTVSSPGGEEQKQDPTPSLNQWCGSQTLSLLTAFPIRGCKSTTRNVNERYTCTKRMRNECALPMRGNPEALSMRLRRLDTLRSVRSELLTAALGCTTADKI